MSSPGLRERKKQKTRWAIQEHALRLFAEQGYEATTVDQIAAAAEISPSTFFRYFPTKEDLVIQDQYDDMIVEILRVAPAELGPVGALRWAAKAAFESMSPADESSLRDRSRLVMSVPALRARSLENFLSTTDLIRTSIAERAGRDPDDVELRILAGAIVGAIVGVIEGWLSDGEPVRLAVLIDTVFASIEAGLPGGRSAEPT
jgi:AcrR family transcriptional regulator